MATLKLVTHGELIPFSSKTSGIDYNKPMKADEASSVDLDNDFSDISYNRSVDFPPKHLQVKNVILPGFQQATFPSKPNHFANEKDVMCPLPPFNNWKDKRLNMTEHPVTEPCLGSPVAVKTVIHVNVEQAIQTPQIPFDALHYLKWSMLFIGIEHALFLTCQLLSWYFLENVIEAVHWGLGLGLLCAYLVLAGFMIFWCEKRWAFAIKLVEGLTFCVLISWAVVYLDFSIMSLSYMIVLAVILMWAFVSSSVAVFQDSQHRFHGFHNAAFGCRHHLEIILL